MGLEVEIEGKFLFMDTGERDESVNKLSRKRDLFRSVGVIYTNEFQIGTVSHFVAFTFMSFLKEKEN